MPDLDYIEDRGLPGFKFNDKTVGDVISAAMPYIFAFAGILLLLYFIIGGYKLMFSAGDPKKVAEGRTAVTHALIGFIIVFVAFWITQIIAQFLGLNTILGVFGGNPRPGGR
jgi:uncharacterized membrane protein